MVIQKTITVQTRGRGTQEITHTVNDVVTDAAVTRGICHVFIHHTSASLILCENADPVVRSDLESFMSTLVPDGDSRFRHTMEGPDDMPAHIRTVLTDSGLTIPVSQGRCLLGTWQGIYLWEHRHQAHSRKITITLYGE